jgi:hypothetical protein
MPNRFSEILPQAQDAGHHEEANVPKQAAEESIISGKPLADYL